MKWCINLTHLLAIWAICLTAIGVLVRITQNEIRKRLGLDKMPDIESLPKNINRAEAILFCTMAFFLTTIVGSGIWYFIICPSESRQISEKTEPANTPTSSLQSPSPTTIQTPVPELPEAALSFAYSLELKPRNSAENNTIPATGRRIFESGDDFRIKFESPDDGFLYLINEGASEKGEVTFITQETIEIKKNKPVQTGWLSFDETPGIEKFWFVFAKNPIKVFREEGTQISSEKNLYVRELLNMYKLSDSADKKDAKNSLINVKGTGEIIAYQISFDHR